MAVSSDAPAAFRGGRLYRLALGMKALLGAGFIALGLLVY